MTYRPLIVASLLALATSLPATAAVDCVNFTDVSTADAFCPAVEWLKNRSVTTGCTATEYCPSLNVSRAQMALFMNRLGKSLTPVVLHKEALVANLTVPANDPGALMCATSDYTVTGFPRTAHFIAAFFGTPASGPSWIQGYWKYSVDAGSTWHFVGDWLVTQWVGRDWADYAEVAGATVLAPPMALAPGSTYRFGLFLNGMGGSYPFHSLVCQLDVTIDNANPAASPLDE
jgi:hypothetical protein